jgi:hypothetical protein
LFLSCLLCAPDGFADVALLLVMGVLAVFARQMDDFTGQQRMLPNLVAAGLVIYVPASTREIGAQVAKLARHPPLHSLLF